VSLTVTVSSQTVKYFAKSLHIHRLILHSHGLLYQWWSNGPLHVSSDDQQVALSLGHAAFTLARWYKARDLRTVNPKCNGTSEYLRTPSNIPGKCSDGIALHFFTRTKYQKKLSCTVIEIFALLGCYAAYVGSYRRFGTSYRFHLQVSTINIRCVTSQKREHLIYTAAETWNHASMFYVRHHRFSWPALW
jgi:hypothetical protein